MVSRVELGLAVSLLLLGACVPLIYAETGGEEQEEDSAADESDTGATETGEPEDTTHPCGNTKAFVSEVIDGDTIELSTGDRVRYILVDTPETGGNAGVECWGPQATEYNRMLVEGRAVTLTYDAECRDQYDRLLAYVSVDELDDLDVSAALLENGYACILYIPPNGQGRIGEYQALRDAAEMSGVGMWGACASACN